MSTLSAIWHWTACVCQWIGFLEMLILAAGFVLFAVSAFSGSVLRRRRRERQLSREIIATIASLTDEEVAEWLR